MTTDLEDRIGAALRSAAENIEPTPHPAPHAVAPIRRRRWVAPVAAAIAVLALIASVVVLTAHRVTQREIGRAATLVYTADRADVGGVAFPIPKGWAVAVVQADSSQVRACVAEHPSAACDGVSIAMALPDGPPLQQANLPACAAGMADYQIIQDHASNLGGRPGQHLYQWCGKSGPVTHQWLLLDLGLEIRTPAGEFDEQGRQIAAGLDLSGWSRGSGRQLINWAMGSAAPGASGPTVVSAPDQLSIDGAVVPIPAGWDSLNISSDDTELRFCLARTPTTDCDGVTVRFVLGAGSLPSTMPVDDCAVSPRIPVLDDKFTSIGGRPAQHIIGTCGAETGPAEHLWRLDDSSLQVTTPRGRYAEQGAAVVAGINLDHWQRPQGTVTAAVTAAQTAGNTR